MRQLCAVEPPAPWQVLAVTFTNKAAKELRERLEAFGIAGAGDIWALTFHSACVRILRRDIDKRGFSNDFTIYDTDDCKRVVKDILKEMDLDEKTFSLREVLAVISKAKDELLSPQDFSKKWAGSGDWKRERRQNLRALRPHPLRGERAGLRRPHSPHGAPAAKRAGCTSVLPAQIPLHPHRRVSGHEPDAVRAGALLCGRQSQHLRGRRRRPEHLSLPRRGHLQHPEF